MEGGTGIIFRLLVLTLTGRWVVFVRRARARRGTNAVVVHGTTPYRRICLCAGRTFLGVSFIILGLGLGVLSFIMLMGGARSGCIGG